MRMWIKIIVVTLLLLLSPSSFRSQGVSVFPITNPHQQFFDASGDPLASGFVCTYVAGTSTPLATYTDSIGTIPNSNPVLLDSGGFANIWLIGADTYKYAVYAAGTPPYTCPPATGVLQWTVDGVKGEPNAPPATINVQNYGALVDGTTDVTAAFTTAFAAAVSTGACVAIPSAAQVGGVGYLVHSATVGTVNTSGTAVTWVNGTGFTTGGTWTNESILINNVRYQILNVVNSTSLTLASSAGTQSGVAYTKSAFSFKSPVCINTGSGSGGGGGLFATSLIDTTTINADLFEFAQGSQGSSIQGLSLRTNGVPIGNSAIVVNFTSSLDGDGLSPMTVKELSISNFYDGIVVPTESNPNGLYITKLNIANNIHSGFTARNGLGVYISQSQLLGNGAANIDLEGGAGYWFTDVQTTNATNDLIIHSANQVFATNFIADTSLADAIVINGGSEIEFKGSWATAINPLTGTSGGWGVNCISTTGFNWLGGWIRSSYTGGFHAQAGCTKFSISNARISDNGHNNGSVTCNGIAGACGILVDAGVSYFQIFNNQIGVDNADTANEQKVGVGIATGASDHYQVTGNLNTDFANVTTNFVMDGGTGTHKTVSGNN